MRRRGTALILAACAALSICACATAPTARGLAEPAEPAAASAGSPSAGPKLAPIPWTDEAAAAFEAEVPAMVKKIAKKTMEKKARERGLALIDMAFYQEMKKEQMGG